MVNKKQKLFKNYFNGKKILITGHTGFKGSWLSLILSLLGAKVYGISNSYPDRNNIYSFIKKKLVKDYNFDILDYTKLKKTILLINPDIIFHLAAQSLVYDSYINPKKTFLTNSIGSLNVLEVLRSSDLKTNIIMITSDKCYLNVEKKPGYKETDSLGGKDPYSASKASAEHIIEAYTNSFFKKNNKIKIATARAGNVIGGGDWSKNRIVPDLIKAWNNRKSLSVRSPNSTRPWQHVLEPLFGYLILAYKLNLNNKINGQKFNFGPSANSNYSVGELLNKLSQYLPNSKWHSKKNSKFYEAKLLKLNCSKAKKILDWSPILSFSEVCENTISWYKSYYSGSKKECVDTSINQINSYISKIFK